MRRAGRVIRGSAATAALLCALLAACSSSGSSSARPSARGAVPSPPLALVQIPGDITCLALPAPAVGVTDWESPVAFTTDWYVNQGKQPATIKSVALIDPHGLVLHGSLVYEMVQALHVLYQAIAWTDLERGALPSAWRARQSIPGAVIPTGHAENALTDLSSADNLYVVAENITATSVDGGWAAGEKISYTAGGHSYSITAFTGIAIGSGRTKIADSCDAKLAAIKSTFSRLKISGAN